MIMPKHVENLPIYIKVNKSLLGYMCTIVKEDPKMVLVNLRDMAETALDRLKGRNYGRSTWTKIKYPNTDFHLKLQCKACDNSELRRKHWLQHELKFSKETGIDKPNTKNGKPDFWHEFYKWKEKNPDPNANYNYDSLIIEATLFGAAACIMLSQEEIDTILVENILLAPEE